MKIEKKQPEQDGELTVSIVKKSGMISGCENIGVCGTRIASRAFARGGGSEKVAVCHSDCFGWDGFIMYVKNVDAHVGHGDTEYPKLVSDDVDFALYYLFNDDYCCDYPRIIDPDDDSKCCEPQEVGNPSLGCKT